MKSIHIFDVTANYITSVVNDGDQYGDDFNSPYSQITPSEIMPHLYLGAMEASLKEGLRLYNIAAVLSIGTTPLYISKKVDYLRFSCEDVAEENIARFFQPSYEFIDKYISQNKNVLVHCVAGMSRSVTLVTAYMMKKLQIPLQEAFKTVKEKRQCSYPNSGFVQQLAKYNYKN